MGNIFGTTSTASASLIRPASENQLSYIHSLVSERDWREVQGKEKFTSRVAALMLVHDVLTDDAKFATYRLEGIATAETLGERMNQTLAHMAAGVTDAGAYAWAPLSGEGASKLIDWLKSLPRKDRPIETLGQWEEDERRNDLASTEVPAGRYAVATESGATNELAFYKVDRPTEGRWAGYVFVKHLLGGEEQRLSQKTAKAVLAKIAAAGPEAASAAYGHEIGRCGICHTRLTNDDSRARGIGPKCAANAGW